MPMRIHEIHPALAHFPVALLPTAVAADLLGWATDNRQMNDVGRTLMWTAAATMAATGVAGFVAQAAVKTNKESHEHLVTHRNLNVGLLVLTAGLALLRSRHARPSGVELVAGIGAAALVTYTGYLGGRMVYGHGVGVQPDGVMLEKSPDLQAATLRKSATSAGENAVHAFRHSAEHVAKGEIAPSLRHG